MFRNSLPWFRLKAIFHPWAEMDGWLFSLALGLTVLGGIMIRSVELNHGWTDWWQHWITGGVGIVLALAIACIQYEALLQYHWYIYGLMVLSLIAVRFIGTEALGAQRWISILGFNVQPSEFAKLGIIITLAALLHERSAATLPALLRTLAVAAVPWALVFIEPNLGTSLVFGSITLGMLYWGNANPGWLILMLSPPISAILLNVQIPLWLLWVISMGFVAWFTLPWPRWGALGAVTVNLIAGELGQLMWGLLKEYQKDRILLFLNPDKDPLGGGYHLIQSRIAIGAGEVWGRGLFKGTQTQLNYVPEQHTDFIFTAIGEELGFVGSILVLLAFWLICLRLILIAQGAKDRFGALIAIGVFSMIVFQVVVNIGMTIGLSPVTGIPLPWISYGRSALLMNFMALGVVESVANNSRQGLRF
jgi:rod shape determining protein RodA